MIDQAREKQEKRDSFRQQILGPRRLSAHDVKVKPIKDNRVLANTKIALKKNVFAFEKSRVSLVSGRQSAPTPSSRPSRSAPKTPRNMPAPSPPVERNIPMTHLFEKKQKPRNVRTTMTSRERIHHPRKTVHKQHRKNIILGMTPKVGKRVTQSVITDRAPSIPALGKHNPDIFPMVEN